MPQIIHGGLATKSNGSGDEQQIASPFPQHQQFPLSSQNSSQYRNKQSVDFQLSKAGR